MDIEPAPSRAPPPLRYGRDSRGDCVGMRLGQTSREKKGRLIKGYMHSQQALNVGFCAHEALGHAPNIFAIWGESQCRGNEHALHKDVLCPLQCCS